MKYIMMCVAALLVCLVCAWIPARYIGKKKHFKGAATFLLTIGFSVLLICGVMLGYLSIYYHADPSAAVVSETVKMEVIDGGYLFDGPGEETALIFYPGAKVEALAYAPLLTALSENGVDCFLAKMPFRMAMFGSKIADKFLGRYSYDTWIMAGHSMGGLVASGYASDHADQISELVLLAAYPGNTIPDSIKFCSIYGTKDGCLNMAAYENARKYWPSSASEYIIEGGNHAQYGNYGIQFGDLAPNITREDQQKQVLGTFILAFCLSPVASNTK